MDQLLTWASSYADRVDPMTELRAAASSIALQEEYPPCGEDGADWY